MSGSICIATSPPQRFPQSCERVMGSASDGDGDDDDGDGDDDDHDDHDDDDDDDDDDGDDDHDEYEDDDDDDDGGDDDDGDDDGDGDDAESPIGVHNQFSQKLNKEKGGLTARFQISWLAEVSHRLLARAFH